jgi:hypothetical protein
MNVERVALVAALRWRFGGIVEVLRRSAHHWGDMQRAGFERT